MLLTSKCHQLEHRLSRTSETQRRIVWNTLKSNFNEEATLLAEQSGKLKETGLYNSFLILTASRCVKAIPWKEPTIKNVVEFAGLSRNFVGNVILVLGTFGLLEKTRKGRSEIISLTRLGELYSDLLADNTDLVRLCYEKIAKELETGNFTEESIKGVELAENIFDLIKNMFPKNTLDYEIYNNVLHNKTIQLIVALRLGQKDTAKSLVREIMENLVVLDKSKKKAKSLGLESLRLEDTGEKVGRGRVFRPVRMK